MSRTAEVELDRTWIAVAVIVGTLIVAAGSFAAGFPALVAVAQSAGMSGYLAWLVPVVYDGGVVILSLSAMTQRARGKSAKLMWTVSGVLAVVSVAAQVAHATDQSGTAPWAKLVATLTVALLPVITLVAAESALRLFVDSPVRARRQQAAVREAAHQADRMTDRGGPQATAQIAPPDQTARVDPALSPVQTTQVRAAAATKTSPAVRPAPRRATAQTTTTRVDRQQIIAQARTMLAQGQSQQAVATALGVPKTNLMRWISQANADREGQPRAA